jgi:DNA-binding transcriptional MocR family regulator
MPTANPFADTLPRRTLAEQMADALTEAILAGRPAAGEALPTEPELAAQFGVSRAVVRDATRMLVARGLVEAQHGRGVFVTGSPVAAFGDACCWPCAEPGPRPGMWSSSSAWSCLKFMPRLPKRRRTRRSP